MSSTAAITTIDRQSFLVIAYLERIIPSAPVVMHNLVEIHNPVAIYRL